ncbi:KDP operon transcriptional regulatory protein KdpE [Alphaproteobacteria bacterium SO-S41]|nr:KDP operon transcriptional regulatory protein KdpE [Alphaproteobacteria bacterium SO-S41]
MSVPILIVDDEAPIRRLLRTSLGTQGFEIFEAATAAEAETLLAREKPDIVLLDLGLPDKDGMDVVRALRAAGDRTPVIILSARGEERSKVEALDAGADDYVTKPFGIAELVARIRAALRHRVQEQGAEPVFDHDGLHVDLTRRLVTVEGREVKLSPKEFDILRQLVLHAGKVLTHRMLMREVWGAGGDVQYLRIYVRQLRHKLERDPERPSRILTETGIGYRLSA